MKKIVIGSSVRHYATVSSTNDVALELASAGAVEGTVVRADEQQRGRGRIGRSWNSGAGKGLYLTVILRPEIPVSALGLLSLAAGASVREALRGISGLEGTIKWPNDVLVSGKKIAGVLIESRAGVSGISNLLLGIGINTDWEEADLKGEFRIPPTAVNLETGSPAQTELLFSSSLTALDRFYREVCSGECRRLLRAVSEQLDGKGRNATLSLPDRRVNGILEGITPDGGLILKTETGAERFYSGELEYADRC